MMVCEESKIGGFGKMLKRVRVAIGVVGFADPLTLFCPFTKRFRNN